MTRELDQEVAVKVFGYAWDESRCRVCGWPFAGEDGVGCFPSDCSRRPLPEISADTPANYSGNISLAFQVVEKMRERGWYIEMIVSTEEIYCYMTLFKDGEEQETRRHSKGDSMPEAICRAALAALNAKEIK